MKIQAIQKLTLLDFFIFFSGGDAAADMPLPQIGFQHFLHLQKKLIINILQSLADIFMYR